MGNSRLSVAEARSLLVDVYLGKGDLEEVLDFVMGMEAGVVLEIVEEYV